MKHVWVLTLKSTEEFNIDLDFLGVYATAEAAKREAEKNHTDALPWRRVSDECEIASVDDLGTEYIIKRWEVVGP